MVLRKKVLAVSIGLIFSLTLLANTAGVGERNQNRDKLLGNLIKNALETYHYRGAKIDEDLSSKAFDEFLKRLDFRKQFLWQSDVKSLERHRRNMGNQLTSGKLDLVVEAMTVVNQRIAEAEDFRVKTFKQPFNLTQEGTLELDPEKRNWVSNKREFEQYWRSIYKYDVINRFLELKEAERKRIEALASEETEKKENNKESVEVAKKSDEKLLKEAIDSISSRYERLFTRLSENGHNEIYERFVNSLAMIFDPHTSYLPPQRKEDFDIDISGSLEGIGAVLQEDGDYIKVVQIVPGGPAWRQQKLEVDDIILWVAQGDMKKKKGEDSKLEQTDLIGMRVSDAVRHIRGPKGSTVNLMVRKPDGSTSLIPIERDVIQVGSTYARSSVIQHKNLETKIGYIYLPKFYRDFGNGSRNCTDDVRRELNRLATQNVDAIVLDLRNNGGGALEDARQMSGLFIPEGPIVQIRDHRGQIDVLRDTSKQVVYNGPLIVLINRFSASASEILAGALQDYGRAIIVGGEYTHGKGTVQAVLDLNRNPIANIISGGDSFGALKVTIQTFYRITGSSTQFKGITPDIVLPDPFGHTKSREQDLDHALPWESVDPLTFTPWTGGAYNVDTLRERSQKRVKKDQRFERIRQTVDYFNERRSDTLVPLSMSTNLERDQRNRARLEELRVDEVNESIIVSHYEPSLRENANIRQEDMEQWQKDLELTAKEWIEEIQKDPILEEVAFIIDDMVRINRGQKLGMLQRAQ